MISSCHSSFHLVTHQVHVGYVTVLILIRRAHLAHMGTIPVSQGRVLNQLRGRLLPIVRPADFGEQIDPHGRDIERVVAQLGCLVVPRENMMVVVPSLAHRKCGDNAILRRADAPVDK